MLKVKVYDHKRLVEVSPKFRTFKEAYEFLTPHYLDGRKIEIVGKRAKRSR